eukprot:TRINITY_DN3962_c0_g2_i5.p1 TRINITY_DN3962_c0_g2~~TRINITY_DN3962_c0_g2_i5.p1  ORF type:complete len:810 (-),score=119.80 TRINITY_DN3962_c0_g2_i5:101-2530(-)
MFILARDDTCGGGELPAVRPSSMKEWSKEEVSRWLFDTCRVLPEINQVITDEVVRRNPTRPGKALSILSFKDLQTLCKDAITKFGLAVPSTAKTYWHASRILHEKNLRSEFCERYIVNAVPYAWPYNGIIHPGNTALLVIDMQRDFMELGGYMNLVNPDWKPDLSIIDPIKNLLRRFRRDHYHIIHTREGHEANLMDLPLNKYWRSRGNKDYSYTPACPGIGDGFKILDAKGQPTGPFSRVLTRGDVGWDFIAECKPLEGETVIDKPTIGSFGNTELELHLHTRKIQNIVITGVTTDVCVSTIMREANDRGFECILVTDATASADPTVKDAIIESVHLSNGIFGCTATSEEILACLSDGESYAETDTPEPVSVPLTELSLSSSRTKVTLKKSTTCDSATGVKPFSRPQDMREWNAEEISQWLFDTCRVLPEVNKRITGEMVSRDRQNPGQSLARLGFQDLRKLCGGSITQFGDDIAPVAKNYWHASAILQEISLRNDLPERYVMEAVPYCWPYNGIIHPGNTALLVIDMQRDFMELGGYMNLVNPTWKPDTSIIDPIKNLLRRFRKEGYHVIHTREGHEPNLKDLPANKYWRSRGNKSYKEDLKEPSPGIGDGFYMQDGRSTFSRVLTRGEPGWEIMEECLPENGETVIDKPTKGAFANTEIELHLNSKKIQNIVITGVTTDVCVSTIMREANDRGFECLLVTDATASANPIVKEKIIHSIHLSNGIFGCTATSEQLLNCLNVTVVKTEKCLSVPRGHEGGTDSQTDHDEITLEYLSDGSKRKTTVTVHVTTKPTYSVVRDPPVTVMVY